MTRAVLSLGSNLGDRYGHLSRAVMGLGDAILVVSGVRDPTRPFGPRTLDVDVIAVWADNGGPVTSDDLEFTLPHPRAHLRAFVLRPWLDVQPYAQLPGHGWVYDLVRTGPIMVDLAHLTPRPDLDLTPDLNG